MAGLFICPYCGAATQVSEEFAGMSGPCASCSRIITVPAHGASTGRRRFRSSGDRSTWVLATVAVLLFVGLGYGGKIVVDMLKARAQQEECAGQLHKIWVGMDNYFNEYSEYPPAVVRDKNGKPMHSWRVLLLPYLGQREEELYKEYDFNEPWNGPNNRELAEAMPLVYGCPCDPEAFISSHTSYLAVLDGATGDFATEPENPDVNRPPPKPGASTKPITPYLVVEVAESGISWLEPRDLTLRSPGVKSKPGQKKAKASESGAKPASAPYPRSFHLDAVNVLQSDGQDQALTEAEVQAAFGSPE
ncbi:MAG TPA: DUF1559 domain-containing protein [Pirellulales bacterium]|nr:DUF1559 domain-containing protein [Pirellulales bacterium]